MDPQPPSRAPAAVVPGRRMAAEIAEQPAVWRRLLTDAREQIDSAAGVVRRRRPRFALLLGRGTSGNAALYAKYLLETTHGIPAGLVAPSTTTVYGARPDLRDVLMVAVSQSGGSPDLLRCVDAGRAAGALTLALTNNPASELAAAAELSVDLRAGTELAVAATKSYTAQLLALYLLLDRVGGGSGSAATSLPDLGDQVLCGTGLVAGLAQRYRFASRAVVTARGYSLPTAHEAALKLMETSYLSAQAMSGADLLHGPVAMVDPQLPVLAVVPSGAAGAAMDQVLARLRHLGADVLVVGARDAVARATVGVPLPGGVPEALSPVVEILPLQQLALHLAIARGGDPDAPRGLSKVTETV